jgi:hypothetical protein
MCDIIEGKSHSNKGDVPSYELVPIMDKDLADLQMEQLVEVM